LLLQVSEKEFVLKEREREKEIEDEACGSLAIMHMQEILTD